MTWSCSKRPEKILVIWSAFRFISPGICNFFFVGVFYVQSNFPLHVDLIPQRHGLHIRGSQNLEKSIAACNDEPLVCPRSSSLLSCFVICVCTSFWIFVASRGLTRTYSFGSVIFPYLSTNLATSTALLVEQNIKRSALPRGCSSRTMKHGVPFAHPQHSFTGYVVIVR